MKKHADFPLPDTSWEPTRGFWEAAARGELAIPRCAACAAYNWYPREACARCGGTDMPWTAVSGRGSLFSWAVVRRALMKELREKAPYVTGLVALEEDPSVRIVTMLVDCDPDALQWVFLLNDEEHTIQGSKRLAKQFVSLLANATTEWSFVLIQPSRRHQWRKLVVCKSEHEQELRKLLGTR